MNQTVLPKPRRVLFGALCGVVCLVVVASCGGSSETGTDSTSSNQAEVENLVGESVSNQIGLATEPSTSIASARVASTTRAQTTSTAPANTALVTIRAAVLDLAAEPTQPPVTSGESTTSESNEDPSNLNHGHSDERANGPSPSQCPAAPTTSREKAARVVMIGITPGQIASAGPEMLSRRESPGGVFVAGDLSPTTAVNLSNLAAQHQILFAADEEGGRVQAIENVHGPLESAAQLARLTPAEIRAKAEERGRQLLAIGINMDLAPVVDIERSTGPAIVGNRAFGDTPEAVTVGAGAFARGLRDANVLPTLKHFPGHGSATGDSHNEVVTTEPIAELDGWDIEPFRTLTQQTPVAVMIGHLAVPGLSDDIPASLSSPAYEYLRSNVGFDGIIITDDLSAMRGVTQFGSAGEIGLQAFEAGADIVLYVSRSDFTPVVDAIAAAAAGDTDLEGRLDASIRRITAASGCS